MPRAVSSPRSSAARNSFRQTATVERTEPGPLNPLGQPTGGVTTTRTVRCRLWEHRQSEITGDGKYFTLSRWQMRVPLGADIREHDRVTVGGRQLTVETTPTRRHGHMVVQLENA